MPYHGYYYGIDMYYIVLVLPCVLFAFWAQNKVNSTFNRYSRVQNLRGLTGAQAARWVLDRNGLSNVPIEHISGGCPAVQRRFRCADRVRFRQADRPF